MSKDSYDVAIVGGGHAGAQAAISLRQKGFEGSIAIVSDERDLPYERPPLSKEYLAGEKPFERLLLRPEAFWQERDIEMLLSRRVIGVDPAAKTITCNDDQVIRFGKLIWAAGGSPRMLPCPGSNAPQVHGVRRRSDIDAILAALPNTQNIAIVGGGYIGLEAAAVLRKLGKDVLLVEAQDRVLNRVAGEELSRFYEQEHVAQGVDLHLNTGVERIETDEAGNVTAITTTGGDRHPADMVLVGIGIIPDVAPLMKAGAAGGNGVDVDRHCRTSLDNIYAIGDCAAHANRYADGAMIRLESVQNASDMAKVAAADIAGEPIDYNSVPWFWSNQYDLRLQTVGLSVGHDQAVLRGDPADRSFSLAYLRDGRFIAIDAVNRPKDYVQGRKLVEEGATLDVDELADSERPLKEVQRL